MSKDIYKMHKSLCSVFDFDSFSNPISDSSLIDFPSQDYLKGIFYYEDGELFRKTDVARKKVRKGAPAGRLHKATGRKRVCIDGIRYPLHKIIFLYHHGYYPKLVDHKDGNPLNNRICNLRDATISQNNCNQKIRKDNSSGYKGISFYEKLKCIHAQIQINGKKYHKHLYPITNENLNIALDWIKEKRKELHGEFARGK